MLTALAGGTEVSDEDFELVHGGDTILRDLGLPEADILRMKADLAARIIHELEARKLTVRAASALTGFAAADFSRVRQAKVTGFTLDRLVGMLGRLDQHAEVSVAVRPRPIVATS